MEADFKESVKASTMWPKKAVTFTLSINIQNVKTADKNISNDFDDKRGNDAIKENQSTQQKTEKKEKGVFKSKKQTKQDGIN